MNLKTVNRRGTVGPIILPCQNLKFIKTTIRILPKLKSIVVSTLEFIDRVNSIKVVEPYFRQVHE